MAVIDIELAVFLCAMMLTQRAVKYLETATAPLTGLPIYGVPEPAAIEQVMGTKKQLPPPSPERTSKLKADAEQLLRHFSALLTAGRHSPFKWDSMIAWGSWTALLTVSIVAAATWAVSMAWSVITWRDLQSPSALAPALAAGAAVGILAQLLLTRPSDTMEFRLSFWTGAAAALLAFLCQYAPESSIDTGLTAGVATVLRALPDVFDVPVETGTALANAAVAGGAGIVACVLMLPALRFSKCYMSILAHAGSGPSAWATKALAYANMWLPWVALSLWVRPLGGNLVLQPGLVKCSADAPARDCSVFDEPNAPWYKLTESGWFALRLWVTAAVVLVRLASLRMWMRAYLRTAADAQVLQLTHAYSGWTTRAPKVATVHAACRTSAVAVNANVLTAAVQYLAPAVLMGGLAALAARLGAVDMGVSATYSAGLQAAGLPANATALASPSTSPLVASMDMAAQWAIDNAGLSVQVGEAGARAALHNALAPLTLLRPLLSFALLWVLIAWVATTTIGMLYFRGVATAADQIAAGAPDDDLVATDEAGTERMSRKARRKAERSAKKQKKQQ